MVRVYNYNDTKMLKAIEAYQQFPCQETLEHIAMLIEWHYANRAAVPDEIMAILILERMIDNE